MAIKIGESDVTTRILQFLVVALIKIVEMSSAVILLSMIVESGERLFFFFLDVHDER